MQIIIDKRLFQRKKVQSERIERKFDWEKKHPTSMENRWIAFDVESRLFNVTKTDSHSCACESRVVNWYSRINCFEMVCEKFIWNVQLFKFSSTFIKVCFIYVSDVFVWFFLLVPRQEYQNCSFRNDVPSQLLQMKCIIVNAGYRTWDQQLF